MTDLLKETSEHILTLSLGKHLFEIDEIRSHCAGKGFHKGNRTLGFAQENLIS